MGDGHGAFLEGFLRLNATHFTQSSGVEPDTSPSAGYEKGAAAAAPIVVMKAHSMASFLAAVTAFLGSTNSSTPLSNLARALASSTAWPRVKLR